MDNNMDNMIGRRLDGRYELLELIGTGGMADIYKARDITEDRIVAVKILKNEFAGSEDFLRRFRNESKAIALLSHPNIVKIYDVGFNEQIQFIVMEYIDGISLAEYIKLQGVCLKHLQKYEPNERIRFSQITQEWVQGFRDYLEKDACAWSCDERDRIKDHPLSRNSRVSYFNKLRACLNQAYEDRIIPINPMRGVEGFKAEEGTRMYLTIEEVQRLAQTECEYPAIKRAFLFSCLTGLRRSDVIRLTWGDVHQQGEFTRIIFKQKKTSGQEYLDIPPQAAELMGERGKGAEHIFPNIHSPSCTNETIKRWVLRAGIHKDITFHCGRHTFAVMMLDLGTDIYTVSKLLGHRELSTTQIYAKVRDKNKQAAVAKIPDIF